MAAICSIQAPLACAARCGMSGWPIQVIGQAGMRRKSAPKGRRCRRQRRPTLSASSPTVCRSRSRSKDRRRRSRSRDKDSRRRSRSRGDRRRSRSRDRRRRSRSRGGVCLIAAQPSCTLPHPATLCFTSFQLLAHRFHGPLCQTLIAAQLKSRCSSKPACLLTYPRASLRASLHNYECLQMRTATRGGWAAAAGGTLTQPSTSMTRLPPCARPTRHTTPLKVSGVLGCQCAVCSVRGMLVCLYACVALWFCSATWLWSACGRQACLAESTRIALCPATNSVLPANLLCHSLPSRPPPCSPTPNAGAAAACEAAGVAAAGGVGCGRCLQDAARGVCGQLDSGPGHWCVCGACVVGCVWLCGCKPDWVRGWPAACPVPLRCVAVA
jgi:hypothetical protein